MEVHSSWIPIAMSYKLLEVASWMICHPQLLRSRCCATSGVFRVELERGGWATTTAGSLNPARISFFPQVFPWERPQFEEEHRWNWVNFVGPMLESWWRPLAFGWLRGCDESFWQMRSPSSLEMLRHHEVWYWLRMQSCNQHILSAFPTPGIYNYICI